MLRALGGLKVGRPGERVGLFVKGRVGVSSHTGALKSRASSPYTVVWGRSNLPVLDLGGVVEVATGPRMLLRFEAGDGITKHERPSLRLWRSPGFGWSWPKSFDGR